MMTRHRQTRVSAPPMRASPLARLTLLCVAARVAHALHSSALPTRAAASRAAAASVAARVETEVLTQTQLNSLALSCAIAASSWGGDGIEEAELQKAMASALPRMNAIAEACRRAPALETKDAAAALQSALPLARLAAWATEEEWVRPVEEWEGCDDESMRAALRSLIAHLLERYEVPPSLQEPLLHTDGAPCTEAAHRVAHAFASVQRFAGGGHGSVLEGLRTVVSPAMSKTVAKHFVAAEGMGNPLHALRFAQVQALGSKLSDELRGSVFDGVRSARIGSGLGSASEEEFAQTAIQWLCQHADDVSEPSTIAHTLNYFCEMHRADADFGVFGRTPKTVAAAIDAYEASTIEFDDDEAFQPNPRGIRPLFLTDTTVPKGTMVQVPYDPSVYRLGGKDQMGSRPATIRIAEVLSLRRLIYEGQQLGNCLEDKFRSQVKYISRARQRVSSFWSLTKQEEGADKPEHLLLIEVWHLRGGNIIRQAEGPRPRTIPGPEAWYWMEVWCEREGVDASTWDCYS